MWHYILTKFHKDFYRRSSIIKVLPQKFERLWNVGITDGRNFLLNCATEMGSGAVIYVPSFIMIGSRIQKLIGGYTHTQTAR
jgi:hypothetical protein